MQSAELIAFNLENKYPHLIVVQSINPHIHYFFDQEHSGVGILIGNRKIYLKMTDAKTIASEFQSILEESQFLRPRKEPTT